MSLSHVPLHVHTEYSLLDGASRISQLVSRAKEMGLPAISITDHGVMYGCYEMLQECKKQQIKPIIGSEAYVINGDHTDKSGRVPLYHLVLLAKNDIGYKNLSKIISESATEGFYYKPRVSKEYLKDHSEGLICLTACLGGEVPNLLMHGKYEEAKQAALFYQGVFGEDFYLEIQDHKIPEEVFVNEQMLKLSNEIGAKIVATNDSHFTSKKDAMLHDVILCMQTSKLVTDFPRMRFSGHEYLKDGMEMAALYPQIQDRGLIHKAIEDNTLEILEKIADYGILEAGGNRMPNAPVPEGETNESHLRKSCYALAMERYEELRPDVLKRLEYELSVIEDKGFAGYFLIVADFIKYARTSGIPVGPGRGSAAGSIVAYVLGITNIDPLRYNLLFERFLNPERESMPDIDTDFCIERRGEIIEYVRRVYGDDRVAQIITFNRLTSKAVIKDVARTLEYPFKKSDELARTIPVVRGKPRKIDWMVENHPEFKKAYELDEHARTVIDIAKEIEGTNKNFGVHAAGVIISDVPLTEVVPLARSKDGSIITQYAMDHCASLGLLKMDFLGLRNLTMIHKALDIIKETTGDEIDIDDVSLDDPKVYELLSQGELTGIFQLETSAGMRQVARDMKPSNIEDISAIIALYRPGPLDTGMVDEFIDRKQGRKAIEYKTPELEEILADTYGTIVYQEQIMQIAQKLAGFSLGEADLLRRAMGKKKPEEMLKYKELFLTGCEKNKIKQSVAEELFEMMMAFAEYCFNKSHSAAYAMVSYQTAWLKANYPVQYLTALMSSVLGDQDKVRFYITEAQRMGIEVLPPDINISGHFFTARPEQSEIRFGLTAIKGVGSGAVEEIMKIRDAKGTFSSLMDLCKKVNIKVVTRKNLENLILTGAFDSISRNSRRGLVESLDSVMEQAAKQALGQIDLFGLMNSNTDEATPYEGDIKEEFSEDEINKFERDYLGFYVTGHPLSRYQQKLAYFSTHNVSDLSSLAEGTDVVVTVLLSAFAKRMTKKNTLMALGTGEDLTNKVEMIFFSKVLERFEDLLQEEARLLIRGKVNLKGEGEVSLMVNSVSSLDDLSYLFIQVHDDASISASEWENRFIGLKKILKQSAGDIPIILRVNKKELLLDPQLWCGLDYGIVADINSQGWFQAELKTI